MYSIFSILYLPVEIFNVVSSILFKLFSIESMALGYLIVFIEKLAPYVFLLFAKNTESIN